MFYCSILSFLGLFWSRFPDWKNLRTLTISAPRDENSEKTHLEPQVSEEIKEFLHHFIDGHVGEPIYIADGLHLVSSNLMIQMIFGKRFAYDDPSFNKVVKAMKNSFSLLSKLSLLSNVPFAGLLRKSMDKKINYLSHQVTRPFFIRHYEDHPAAAHTNYLSNIFDRFKLKMENSTTKEERLCFSGEILSFYYLHQHSDTFH